MFSTISIIFYCKKIVIGSISDFPFRIKVYQPTLCAKGEIFLCPVKFGVTPVAPQYRANRGS